MNEVRGDGIETVIEVPRILRDFAKEIRRAKVDNIDWFYDAATRHFAELAGCEVTGESIAERNCMLPLKVTLKSANGLATEEKENTDKQAASEAYEKAKQAEDEEAKRAEAEKIQAEEDEAKQAADREAKQTAAEKSQIHSEEVNQAEAEKQKSSTEQQEEAPQQEEETSTQPEPTSVEQTPVVPFDNSNKTMTKSCCIS